MSQSPSNHPVRSYRPLLVLAVLLGLSMLLPLQASAQGFEIDLITNYDPIWNDAGSGADADGSFWRPMPGPGWYRLGHHSKQGHNAPSEATMVIKALVEGAIVQPVDYVLIWNDGGSGSDADGSVWHPVCADGYVALGDVAQRGYNKPALDEVVCVRTDLVVRAEVGSSIWADHGSGGDRDFSSWGVRFSNDYQSLGLFYGSSSYSPPSAGTFFALR